MRDSDTLTHFTDRLLAINPAYVDLFIAESDEDFEFAFNQLLMKAIDNLETNKNKHRTLDEEGMTGVLAAALTVPGLVVTRETNSNGHVDIMIRFPLCNPEKKKIGEAKIYNGKRYHFEGIDQLLGYMTGRECRGLMLVYVRKHNIAKLFTQLKQDMDKEMPAAQQGRTQDDDLKWSFLSVHKHGSGECIEVSHVGINLYNGKP